MSKILVLILIKAKCVPTNITSTILNLSMNNIFTIFFSWENLKTVSTHLKIIAKVAVKVYHTIHIWCLGTYILTRIAFMCSGSVHRSLNFKTHGETPVIKIRHLFNNNLSFILYLRDTIILKYWINSDYALN